MFSLRSNCLPSGASLGRKSYFASLKRLFAALTACLPAFRLEGKEASFPSLRSGKAHPSALRFEVLPSLRPAERQRSVVVAPPAAFDRWRLLHDAR